MKTPHLLGLKISRPYCLAFSFRPALCLIAIAAVLSGCAATSVNPNKDGCKLRAYTNLGLQDYLKGRYHSGQAVRTAIIPFDVQETFAPPGNESVHFGRELARKFHNELSRSGVLPIVELFNLDRWPGKREEFFKGNHQAIGYARDAGYDLVILGYLDDIKNDEELNVYTKIIDTANYITIWSAKTLVYSKDRSIRRMLSRTWFFYDQPDRFAFADQSDLLAMCLTKDILESDPVP